MNTEITTLQAQKEIGTIVWWSLSGEVDNTGIRDALEAEGFSDEWWPNTPRMETIAQRAANSAISGEEQSIRTLKKRKLWEIVTERVEKDEDDDDQLKHTANVRISVTEKSQILVTPLTEDDVSLATKIAENVDLCMGSLMSRDISVWLVSVMNHQVSAVTLRDGGGFYFVPAGESLDIWDRICRVIAEVSDHKIHSMTILENEDAIEAILAAMRHEIEQTMSEIDEYLAGTTATRGLNVWKRTLVEIQDKLAIYSNLCGVYELPELNDRSVQLLSDIQTILDQRAKAPRVKREKPAIAAE